MSTSDGPRILGALEVIDAIAVVRMEDRFDTPLEDMWSAITQPDRIARWLGEVDGDLQVGGAFTAHFFSSGWEGSGRVIACEPPWRLFVATHESPTPPDEGATSHTIEVTLRADGAETLLTWEERGMPVDLIAAYGAGIQTHVEDLTSYLAGGGRCEPDPRFEELYPAYEELASALS